MRELATQTQSSRGPETPDRIHAGLLLRMLYRIDTERVSPEALARDCGVSTKTVRRTLARAAIEFGVIAVWHRKYRALLIEQWGVFNQEAVKRQAKKLFFTPKPNPRLAHAVTQKRSSQTEEPT